MRKYSFLKLIFLLLLAFIAKEDLYAQFEEGQPFGISTPIEGTNIVTNATNTVTYTSAGETSKKISNIITFKINEQSNIYFASAFTATVNLTIESWPALSGSGNQPHTETQNLTINYDPATGAKYNVRSYYVLPSSNEQVKITVNRIAVTGASGWAPLQVLQLENEMKVLRYYTLSAKATDLAPTFHDPVFNDDAIGDTDAVKLSWSWPTTANNNLTQLEWAWVENEMLSYYPIIPFRNVLDMNNIFVTNSTRVDLTDNNFSVPLLYDGVGHLYYRVRAVDRKDNGEIIAGPWSVIDSLPFGGHAPNLNWQSTTSFAEDAKLKSVVQYFDGSLRNRQTVTKDYSTRNTIVGETIYDMQGRPNVQILPTPTIDSVIHYFKNFNKFVGQASITNTDGSQYLDDPARYFDLTPADIKCSKSPALDDTYTSGSAKYYSANNDWLSKEAKTKNIPDAQGYPYTETRYTDDPTQRVQSQGGVGINHQIGSNHETKYFYGKPAQQELDALFGTEVGDASHYSKNMVQDANGQLSVSYVDMHGRTIATALEGASPSQLNSIDNPTDYPSATGTLTNQLLTPSTNVIKGNSIESISTILVPVPTLDTFYYSLLPAIYSRMDCNNNQICFDCKYNLEISIRSEECTDNPPFVYDYNNLQIVPANAACGTSMGFVGDGITVPTNQIMGTVPLTTGSWVIRKTLTINDSMFQVRKDSALKVFLCTTETHLYDSILTVLTTSSGCSLPSSTPVDLSNLGTLQRIRNQMLADMTPYTGQYALPTDYPHQLQAQYNIFNTLFYVNGSTVGRTPEYQSVSYLDNQGNPVSLPNGISPDNFTNLFQPSWANSLLKYHPEYSKLSYATSNLSAAFTYLDNLQACTSYSGAQGLKCISGGANDYSIMLSDPYFTRIGSSSVDYQNMMKYLTASTNSASGYPSIWQIANSSVTCATVSDEGQSDCIGAADKNGLDPSITAPADRDKVAQRFIATYLSYRNAMVTAYINAAPGGLSQVNMDTLENEGKQLYFVSTADIVNQNGWSSFLTPALISSGDATGVAAAASNYINANDLTPDNCVAQKPFWKAKLLQCEQFVALLNNDNKNDSATVNNIINSILDGMVTVCHNSITPTQTSGASTVNPSYTGVPQSFEDVVNQVFAQNGIATLPNNNYFCNPFTIDYPRPFGDNPTIAVNYSTTIDSCGCAMYAQLKGEASSMGFDTLSFSSMNNFLKTNYDDSLTLPLWTGLQQCKYQLVCNTQYGPINFGTTPPAEDLPAPQNEGCGPVGAVLNEVTASGYSTTTNKAAIIVKYTVPSNGSSNHYDLEIYAYPSKQLISDLPLNIIRGGNKPTEQSLLVYVPLAPVTAYTFVIATNLHAGPCHATSNTIALDTTWQTICAMGYQPIKLADEAVIPTFLNCDYHKPCITCGQLDTLTVEFRQIFPAYSGVPYMDPVNTTDDQRSQNALWARFLNYRTGLSKNPDDYITAYTACGLTAPPCGPGSGVDYLYVYSRVSPYQAEYTARKGVFVQPSFESRTPDDFLIDINPSLTDCPREDNYGNTALCSFSQPLSDASNLFPPDTDPCEESETAASFQAQFEFDNLQSTLIANFDSAYTATCLGAQSHEAFYLKYKPSEYHYTLYYYDQAGNLIKTLPPAAVKPDYDPVDLYNDSVARANDNDLPSKTNNEALGTRYVYNTLNQVTKQKSPDAGISQFWYDKVGRLAVSQNAKQITNALYGYTMYDPLGRIIEVGQKPEGTTMQQPISQDPTALGNWLSGGSPKQQITRTFYDEPFTPIAFGKAPDEGLYQQNLRNRVSFIYIENTDNAANWDAATFYSYDPHGNIDTLLQDYKSGMGTIHCNNSNGTNEYKRVVYNYDLISGKVNQVVYQPGMADQFYHRYRYDAENRLTCVQTSKDSVYWENDASYDYYRHGPLARTVLGQNQVQGIDYAYTLQGWSKGINSSYLNSSTDMGGDGAATGDNSLVSKDAYSFTLGYFNGDYLPIGGSTTQAFTQNVPGEDGIKTDGTLTSNLYNGNISYSFNSLWPLDYNTSTGASTFMGYNYTYDQLNRLSGVSASKSSTTTTGSNAASWPMTTNAPLENVTYDPNGNIVSYLRNRVTTAGGAFTAMDNLSYSYRPNMNQLQSVTDAVTTHTDDIGGTHTYNYDPIGELTGEQETSQHINNAITWTVYGKIQTITQYDGTTINYTYDASGNRISKVVKVGGQITSTYYVRDASDNVMSVYTINSNVNNNDLTQSEIDLYGSDRLGIYNVNVDVENCANNPVTTPTIFTRGNKLFELNNQLGNVMVTISDKKIGHLLSGGTTVDYYIPDVITGNDYYPFGMIESGRTYSQPNSSYRYGFNGQEKSTEIDPNGNLNAAEFWEYDSRIGRRWNTDPKPRVGVSFYSCLGNNPIWNKDALGDSDGVGTIPGTAGSFSLQNPGGGAYNLYNNTTGAPYAGANQQALSLITVWNQEATNPNPDIRNRFNSMQQDNLNHNVILGGAPAVGAAAPPVVVNAAGVVTGTNTYFTGRTKVDGPEDHMTLNGSPVPNGVADYRAQFAKQFLSQAYLATNSVIAGSGGTTLEGSSQQANGYINIASRVVTPLDANAPVLTNTHEGVNGFAQSPKFYSDGAYIENVILGQVWHAAGLRKFYIAPLITPGTSNNLGGVNGTLNIQQGVFSTIGLAHY